MANRKKVLAAMSGGVDSSAAVKLLLDMGYDVAGATMRLFANEDLGIEKSRTCCSLSDVEDARYAAYKLGVPYYVFNFTKEFSENVIDVFVETYLSGATPNPCIDCNKKLKFGKFLSRAEELGYDLIATGHYAVREFDEKTGRWLLKRSPFAKKDQSYVLYGMTQKQLEKTLFPCGSLEKEQVRGIAEENGLINAAKPDSQDICFVPDGDYAGFIEARTDSLAPTGDFVLTDGRVVGKHNGLIRYTVGQRRGLGVSWSEPLFVLDKDLERNQVILGSAQQLLRDSFTVTETNFIPFDKLEKPMEVQVQTRYHQTPSEGIITPLDGKVGVKLKEPKKAVCKGQAAVFYSGDIVVGGGTIQ